SAAGGYVLAGLVPDEYAVTVAAPALAPVTVEHVRLEVGRTLDLPVRLGAAAGQETLTGEATARVGSRRSVVDTVVAAQEIENLPRNGRNFLELSLLAPGNAPAPNFDPTKTNSFAVSSAGQLGRGGNITIDGQDNNDDVVGGPLANLPLDAVQEFQIATNRFSAEQGRSAAAAVNVVTRSGADHPAGSLRGVLRRVSLQGVPATL